MALQIQGNAGVIGEVESNTRAFRVTSRPIDIGSLGSYAFITSSGSMAAGLSSGSPVFSFRWSSTNTCLVRVVRVAVISLGTGFTAGTGFIDMVAARSFTVSDSGGTAVSLSTNNGKRRTSFGTSLLADARISSTAALTAGTRTLDGTALGGIRFGVTTSTNAIQLPTTGIWMPDFSGEWPLVLAQNEGFILRATVPATGLWTLDVQVEWSEVTSY